MTLLSPFTIDRFEQMQLFDEEKCTLLHAAKFIAAMGNDYYARVCSSIVYWGDIPMFAGGWGEVEPGVIEVFLIPDQRILQMPKRFFYWVGWWLKHIKHAPWATKIQSASVDLPRINRFMAALNFGCTGYAKSYTEHGLRYKNWSMTKVNGIWQPY